ncbi:MAG: circularly permuted type 2 ATP-grasp protein [Chloroflexales bacterium]|nr:circularly permuted type 2 ATP-grasp protein [Chloroflexales bacterium]
MDLQTVVAAYHDLLDEASARDTFQRLDAAIRRRGMLVGKNRDRLVCEVLRPRFIVPSQYAVLQPASELVGRAIQKVGAACLTDETLLAPYALTPVERELLAMDPGYMGAALFGRLDGFLAADGSWCWFVESNLESPAGIAYEDALVKDFLALPVMQAFIRDYPVQVFTLWKRLHALLLDAWRVWSGPAANAGSVPNVAIVDYRSAATWPEFEFLRDRFRAAGTPTVVVDPSELSYDGKQLYATIPGQASLPIGLVYRRILQHEFLARSDLSHPLVRAYADGRVCVVNPWRSKPVHTKLIMALLSDAENSAATLLNEAEHAAVQAHIPWTRQVRPGPTTYQGERVVDLLDFVLRNRDRLVLKPNDEYGGSGVLLGWEASEAQWRGALAAALHGPWVVQERVPIPQEEYPTWRPETGLQIAPRNVDSDPCVFGAGLPGGLPIQAAGCLTRIASTALLNVSAGGGAAPPTFLLTDGEDDSFQAVLYSANGG